MREIRRHLIEMLKALATVGAAVDAELVATETETATQERVDEQPVQALAGMSREVWDAHKAVQRAIRATYQLESIGPSAG